MAGMVKLEDRHLNLLAAMKPFVSGSKQNRIDLCLGVCSFASKAGGERISPEAAVELVQVLNAHLARRQAMPPAT